MSAWYRVPYAWLVFSIPALAVVSGIAMLVLSQVNYDGVVVDDYYQRGLTVDRDLARDVRASELGMTARLSLDAKLGTELLVTSTRWRATESIDLKLVHATRPGLDVALRVGRRGEGRYVAPGLALANGAWHLEVSADDWRLRGRLRVPGSGELALAPP